MERRGFLGRLLAIAAAPVVAKDLAPDSVMFRGVEVVSDAEVDVVGYPLQVPKVYGETCFSEIASVLKEVHPRGSFDAAVNQESAFLKALRR